VKYNQLGWSSLPVSPITFGCWELGGGQWEKQSDEVNMQAIEEAFALGITSFDTAEGYGNGHSEEIVGQALAGKRSQVVIATKVSPNHLRPSELRHSAEQSLKRLRTDYIDLYYIHWPNDEIPLADTMNEMRRLQEEGLIKAIGVSNFSRKQMEEAMTVARIDVLQPEYSLLQRKLEKDIVPYCLEQGISIFSYSSIAKGILTGVYHNGKAELKETDFRRNRRLFLPEHLEAEKTLVDLVGRIAQVKGVSMAEIAITWLLYQNAVDSAIVGTQNRKHLEENVRAIDVTLTYEELRELEQGSRQTLVSIEEA